MEAAGAIGQLKAELALYNALKARGYDLIIHLTEHWRGAWLCWLLKPRWAVGPAVKGAPSAGNRVSPTCRPCTTRSAHGRDQSRCAAPARHPAAGGRAAPDAGAGAAAEAVVAAHLAGFGLAGKDFIHVHPASRWFFKCWPVERMAALVDRCRRRAIWWC